MAGENSKIVREQGADKLTVLSGGTIEVQSGGILDLKSGAVFKANGTQAAAIATLTAASGSADDTVADVGGAFNQTTLNNNFKDLATKVNSLITALANVGILAGGS